MLAVRHGNAGLSVFDATFVALSASSSEGSGTALSGMVTTPRPGMCTPSCAAQRSSREGTAVATYAPSATMMQHAQAAITSRDKIETGRCGLLLRCIRYSSAASQGKVGVNFEIGVRLRSRRLGPARRESQRRI